jgi:hypothetical protein
MSTANGKVALSSEAGAELTLPSREQPTHVAGPNLARLMWDAWKAYSHRAGGYQAQVLLSTVYLVVLGPSAIAARITGSRLLDVDARVRPTYWVERKPADKTVAALERQF